MASKKNKTVAAEPTVAEVEEPVVVEEQVADETVEAAVEPAEAPAEAPVEAPAPAAKPVVTEDKKPAAPCPNCKKPANKVKRSVNPNQFWV